MDGYSIAASIMGLIAFLFIVTHFVFRIVHIARHGYLPEDGPVTKTSGLLVRLGF